MELTHLLSLVAQGMMLGTVATLLLCTLTYVFARMQEVESN